MSDNWRITGIKARRDAATPGPWAAGYSWSCRPSGCKDECRDQPREVAVAVPTRDADGKYTVVALCGPAGAADEAQSRADAAFIANARADVDYLLEQDEIKDKALRVIRRERDDALARLSREGQPT